jgi:predicted Zn-dependent protease
VELFVIRQAGKTWAGARWQFAIPAHEIFGMMLMEMKRPADAMKHFTETLRRTPGRPKAIYGIARAAEALGDKQTATKRYTEFLKGWKNADKDLPEIAIARRFINGG